MVSSDEAGGVVKAIFEEIRELHGHPNVASYYRGDRHPAGLPLRSLGTDPPTRRLRSLPGEKERASGELPQRRVKSAASDERGGAARGRERRFAG